MRRVPTTHQTVSTNTLVSAFTLLIGLLCILALTPHFRGFAKIVHEEIMLSIDPSAERYYTYGSDHLDAHTRPFYYDNSRASRLFHGAATIDAQFPNLQHQLARIAFLEGRLEEALSRVDSEIAHNPILTPSSHYLRGLVLGYMGRYDEAALSYAQYLTHDPNNWAANMDISWVLIKAQRYDEALAAIDHGLRSFPDNAWLHNGRAITLYEMGRYDEALLSAQSAAVAVESVTEVLWLTAYPGNDPRIAKDGIATLRNSIAENLKKIQERLVAGQ